MHHMDVSIDYHVWSAMPEHYQDTCQSWPTSCRDERSFCWWYRM